MIRLVTVIENTLTGQRGLFSEHGLSFYLETPDTKLIFDFGESGRMYDNLIKLGLSSRSLDCCICSHSHYDHAGGIKYVLGKLNFDTLITGSGFWISKYKTDGKKFAYLGSGLSKEQLARNGVKHICCTDIMQISKDCWAVSNFERRTEYEKIPSRFVLETAPGRFEPDMFNDEICLVVDTGENLAVIVGCSHPGIINILSTVKKQFSKPIGSVWGGAHLMEADQHQIEMTAAALRDLHLNRIGLCHCSGDQLALVSKFLDNVDCVRIGTGDTVFL